MEFFRGLFRRKPKRVRVKPDNYETFLADLEDCLVGAYPRPRDELKWSIKYWKACLGPIIGFDSSGGIPQAVFDYGGAVKVYKEALRRDIPWEEVCGYVKPKIDYTKYKP